MVEERNKRSKWIPTLELDHHQALPGQVNRSQLPPGSSSVATTVNSVADLPGLLQSHSALWRVGGQMHRCIPSIALFFQVIWLLCLGGITQCPHSESLVSCTPLVLLPKLFPLKSVPLLTFRGRLIDPGHGGILQT